MTDILTCALLRDIEKLYLDSDDYNVTIKVGEGDNVQNFLAHSNILWARSSYFRAALSTNWVKKEDNIIYFDKPNISPKVFEVILNYIYTSKCMIEKIEADNTLIALIDVMIAADELSLLELIIYLEDYILFKKRDWIHKNLVQVWKISLQHETFSKLQTYCNELIDDKPEFLFESEDFTSVDEKILEELLQREDIKIDDEVEIWNKVIRWGIEQEPKLEKELSEWTQADFTELKERLKNLLPHIRFYTIPGNALLHRSPLSKIIHQSQLEIIAKWIDNKELNVNAMEKLATYNFKLLLRGSRDGMSAEKFHELCDNKGSTLIIVKIDGPRKIIGGYNPYSWQSSGKWKNTKKSFIFSFKDRRDAANYILANVFNSQGAVFDGQGSTVAFGDADLGWFARKCSGKSYDKRILETHTFDIEDYEVFRVINE